MDWESAIIVTLAILGLASAGVYAYFKLRSDARSAIADSAKNTIEIISKERDELARQLEIRDVTIKTMREQHATEIGALAQQVATLTELVTKSADVDRLTNLMSEQHSQIIKSIADIKSLVGARRTGDGTQSS